MGLVSSYGVRHLELASVAVLLRFWWCLFFAAGFRFLFVFFPANAHGLQNVSGSLASSFYFLLLNQGRGGGATEAIFAYREKHRFRVRTGFYEYYCTKYNLSVCLSFFFSLNPPADG